MLRSALETAYLITRYSKMNIKTIGRTVKVNNSTYPTPYIATPPLLFLDDTPLLPPRCYSLRRHDAQRPRQHPRPEGAGRREDLTVYVGRDLLRQLHLDLPRPRQVHLGVPEERAPQCRRYEPQDLRPADLLGPDDVEEPVVQPGLWRETEPRTIGSPERHRDEYGFGLDDLPAIQPERGLVTAEAP